MINENKVQQVREGKASMFIKVDGLIEDITGTDIHGEPFEVTFGSSYKILFDYKENQLMLLDAVNGWGNNCYEEFKDSNPILLIPIPLDDFFKGE